MLAKQAAEIKAIKNQLLIDASREANVNDPSYDRLADPAILRVNTRVAVGRRAIEKSCAEWLKGFASSDWQL
eukprot:11403027-Karenia_brevis.AAC.1